MALLPETITFLQRKTTESERAIKLDKEAQRRAEEAEWAAQRAKIEAEEADKLRINALRKEMKEINTQIKADGQSQEGLQLFIEENPAKTGYKTEKKTFTGLPIAQSYSRAVVLTQEGINTFGINRRINWPAQGQIPIFEAEEITLADYDLAYLLPRAEFPSADVLSLKITKLLGY